jgi:hypothetical protein
MAETIAIPSERAAPAARTVRRAGAIAMAAVAIGLWAQLLFFDTGLGINYPLAMAALIAAAWFVPERPTRWPALPDVWLPAAALVLAMFVALRGDPTLVALDILGSLTLATLAIASFGGMEVVRRPFAPIFVLGLRVALAAVGEVAPVVEGIRRRVPLSRARSGAGRMSGVLRGLLLALPLLLLFLVLFSSADAVFGRLVSDLPDLDLDLGSLLGRSMLAVVAAWLTAGLLAYVAIGHESERGLGAIRVHRWLGMTEAITVLVLLDLLFAAFVAVQATYLFGGRDTLEASGLTYAEYARSGFFELLAVALTVGWLVLALETFIARRSRAYVVAVVVLIGLTLVVLASAFLRLRLYQDVYGWTELRFYVLAAIIWLAIGAVAAIAFVLRDKTRWLPHFLVILSVAFGLAFNLIGPARVIAEQNIARLADPSLPADAYQGLDLLYLSTLGDDAMAVIAAHQTDLPQTISGQYVRVIESRLREIRLDPATDDWQAWNLSRDSFLSSLPVRHLLR